LYFLGCESFYKHFLLFVRLWPPTSLPLVGEIGVAGKTVQQLQDHLGAVYEKTVKGAVVTVIIKEIRSRPVFFIGGFGKPGVMQLTRELTLLQAISVVGGVIPNADSEKGFVLRGEKRIPIDFNRLLQKGDLSQNPKLEPGDSVVVPLADAVYVNGEVKQPGAVKYTGDLTILKALTQVGGLTPLASAGRVDVLRGNSEKKERIRVDVDKMMRSPDDNPDIRLQPNDIIFVPQRLF
jgi:polysaccharide export outer membrane protein